MSEKASQKKEKNFGVWVLIALFMNYAITYGVNYVVEKFIINTNYFFWDNSSGIFSELIYLLEEILILNIVLTLIIRGLHGKKDNKTDYLIMTVAFAIILEICMYVCFIFYRSYYYFFSAIDIDIFISLFRNISKYNILSLVVGIVANYLFYKRMISSSVSRKKTTLYPERGLFCEDSPIDRFLKKTLQVIWAMAVILIIATLYFSLKHDNSANLYYMYYMGMFFLAVALLWSRKEAHKASIGNYSNIVLPPDWPTDCAYEEYSKGLNGKEKFQARGGSALSFYNKCQSENAVDFSSSRDRQKMMLIAKKLKETDLSPESIKTLYETGEKDYKFNQSLAKKEQNSREVDKQRIEELQLLAESMRYYGVTGIDKRIKMLRDMIKIAKEKKSDAELDAYAARKNMLKKESDWAIHGGIANGIAGPAAGIVMAANAQARNAEVREYNAQMAPYVYMITSEKKNEAKQFDEAMKRFAQDIAKTEIALVSEDDKDMVFSHLLIKNVKKTVRKTGAVVITAAFSVDKEYRIFDTVKPVIDGCVAARLYQDDKCVASAYFVFPVQGIEEKDIQLSGICTKTSKQGAKYEVKFEPVYLWAMEGL